MGEVYRARDSKLDRDVAIKVLRASQGTLVYAPRRVNASSERSLVWVDRSGRQQPIAAPPRHYSFPRLSADGLRIAVRVEGEPHLWIFHLARQTLTRLTDNGPTVMAVWEPDGRSIVFTGARKGLFRRPADGLGTDELLLAAGSGSRTPTSLSPDGTRLVFHEYVENSAPDLMTLRLDGAGRVEPLLQAPADERDGEISPDGRWLAYDSTVSGRAEVYVRPFPNVNDGLVQVSSDGGRTPVWAPGGRELFFVNGTRMMAATIATTSEFAAERATVLFDDPPCSSTRGHSPQARTGPSTCPATANASSCSRTAVPQPTTTRRRT